MNLQQRADSKDAQLDPRGEYLRGEMEYLQPEFDPAAVDSVIDAMWTAFHSITGIPVGLFQPGSSQSGVSLERQALRFLRKIARVQRSIERLLPAVAAAASFTFNPDNFAVLR